MPATPSRVRNEDFDDSPLASLSRTLESLEARLSRLPSVAGRIGQGPRTQPGSGSPGEEQDRRARREAGSRRPGALADTVSQIALRRQLLDAAADRPATPVRDARSSAVGASVAEPRRQASAERQDDEAPQPLVRRIESLAVEAESLSGEDAGYRLMAEVSAELQRLREEMRQGLDGASSDARFDDMRGAFEQLRQMIGDRESADAIGAELQGISAALARLTEDGADRSMLNAMRSELEELRHLFRESARETTVQAVGERWRTFEDRYAAQAEEDISAKNELKGELERLRESLRSLAREDQVEAVGRRWDAFEERYREAPTEKAISAAIRDELGDVRATLETLSDPAPHRAAEARWDAIEKRLDHRGTDEGIRALAERMSEIEARLLALPNSLDVAALEDRIRSMAGSIEAVSLRSEQVDAQNFHSLEERLDEISRAIVETAGAATIDMAPIERIEERIAALSGRVDQMGDDGKVERLSKRIADLSARVEELAANPAGAAVAERMQTLTERFEATFAEFEPQRIDTAAIEKRIEQIAERFELVVAELDVPRIDAEAVEQRLATLAAKLENSASESRVDVAMVRSLESQIERLSESLSRAGTLHENLESDIDGRLMAIEQRLDGHRETLIHAAREVAEETARRMQAFGEERQAEHVAKLSENLRSLEALSRDNDGRSNQVFEAVHSTLLKIVDRLEQIEFEIAANAGEDFPAYGFASEPSTAFAPAGAAPAADFGLAERAMGVVAATRPREELAAPAIDAGDMLDRREVNRPLEPGSGVPDIGALLERVRAAQRSRMEDAAEPAAADGEAETRAVARQAAKAASLEAEKLREPVVRAEGQGLKALIARRRKAILTGVVAVIVALSALPIGRTLVGARQETRDPTDLAALSPIAPEAAALAADGPALPAREDAVSPAAEPTAASASAPEAPAVSPTPAAPAPATPADEPAVAASVAAPKLDLQASAPETLMANVKAKLPPSALALPPVPDDIGTDALKNAARAGDPKAAFEIGLRLMEGRPGDPQPAKALDWFAQAATKGFAPAQYSLGTLYEKGNGVDRDTTAARDWYMLAADSGNVRAMHNLAVLYATGIEGRSQPETAARWFIQAADHGMRDSQYNLGILYARGSGLQQDLVQSFKWFGIVADAGDNDAAVKRDEIGKSLAADQLAKAQDAIRSFAPAPRVELANTVDTPPEWQDRRDETASIDMTKAVRNIQVILGKLGYDAGAPDGQIGEKTKIAIAAFQKKNGLKETGEIDGPLIRALLQKKGIGTAG